MWQAIYKNVDKNGLNPTIKVTVEYANDYDSQTYQYIHEIMPEDLNSDGFSQVIQSHIDILTGKDQLPVNPKTLVNTMVASAKTTPSISVIQ